MVSSGRQAIACILLIFGTTVCSQAQTNPAKEPTASISGKVTVKGKGVPGIKITAQDPVFRGGWETARFRATTDESGEYRISNVPAGTYHLMPHAIAFTLENEQSTTALVVGDGETIENINFALVRGGVITGKVTDAEGQPLVEENVTLRPIDDRTDYVRMDVGGIVTDDRGVYRAFGLREGKYKVAAGYADRQLPGVVRTGHRQTFYPSTTDEAKATVVEVTAGGEVNNVDIVMTSRVSRGFKVSGRVVDGETGKSLANVGYGISQKFGESGSSSISGSRTNADGEFRFDNVVPGNYSVFVESPQNSDLRANPVPFEVTDRYQGPGNQNGKRSQLIGGCRSRWN
jgi:protocatechuate 3,4-dioxygenase beta subunit